MDKPSSIPYGRKVRLVEDYQCPSSSLDLQPGDEITIRKGKLKTKKAGPRKPAPVVPTGTVGVVKEGPYCSGIFDYDKECPVQFGLKNPMIAETLGVPWRLLEFAD